MYRKTFVAVILIALFATAAGLLAAGCGQGEPTKLVLATTTSTQDSGLLDEILPEFEEKYNVKVKVIAVGTGEALKMGERGDADVLMVHAKTSEDEFVKNGFGLERVEVMENNFIVVGPEADPAGVKGVKTGSDAFKRIAEAGAAGKAIFVSRADDSGTHKKELELWKQAGVDPKGQPWYIETGQGMGETLTITNEKQGYTLSDSATFTAREGTVQLVVLLEGDNSLRNPYSVIVVNPDKFPDLELNTEGAADFAEFLSSDEGQKLIEAYKKNGVQLFIPTSKGETRGMGESTE